MSVCVRDVRVVVTDIMRRGEGTVNDPVRRVLQIWSTDGALLAEWDCQRDSPFIAYQELFDYVEATP